MEIEKIYQIYKKHPHVSIDNRKIEQGCIFISIRGEKFDGNTFAASALQAGAAYAIIDHPDFYIDDRTILVDDSLTALQQLAHYHRRQFSIPFLAVCGSNGKTTTKELLYAVLSSTYKVYATKGNLNNHIGVPLTLLSITGDIEMAIIEIGANHLQETYDLCKIAAPGFGLVTNNGKDHLEGFGSVENVIKANSELYDWLRETGGTAFVNTNHPDLVKTSQQVKKVTYGFELANDYPYQEITGDTFASILWGPGSLKISSRLFGSFNADNMAAAAAVGEFFKVPADKIRSSVENYLPAMNRSQILEKNNITWYIDCYNANPSSMELSLKSFAATPQTPRGIVLADMLELGEFSLEEHGRIVEMLKNMEFNQVVLVGPYFGAFKNEVPCHWFPSTEAMGAWFREQNFTGWSWLIKGSRGYKLESILNF